MVHNRKGPIIKWIGRSDRSNHLGNKVDCYQKCIIGSLTLMVGDHILVSNADAVEPDTVAGCDIAKILHLYEICEEILNKDPYRAIVQWYSRPECIPTKNFENDDISIDFNKEVIEEHRSYDRDISLETVFDKCCVITGDVTESADDLLSSNKRKIIYPIFVCRYKFVKVKKTYKLLPLLSTNKTDLESPKLTKNVQMDLSISPTENYKNNITPVKNSVKACNIKKYKPRPLSEKKKYFKKLGIELIDNDNFDEDECKVSPIKIIGCNNVIRLSSSTNKKKSFEKSEINANYLNSNSNHLSESNTQRNRKSIIDQKHISARRNLNLSLDDEVDSIADPECLNYSLIQNQSAQETNDIKIRLRLSQKQTIRHSSRLASCDFSENRNTHNQRKRVSAIEKAQKNTDIYETPSKLIKDFKTLTVSSRRKSILKSANEQSDYGTPKRNIQMSNIVEKCTYKNDEAIIDTSKNVRRSRKINNKSENSDDDESHSPKKTSRLTITETPKKTPRRSSKCVTPSSKMKLIRSGEITPSIKARQTPSKKVHKSDLQITRESLHVSVIPSSLPCRESEFQSIYKFLESKIQDQCGGCMYVSGIPGTGKTATVTSAIHTLQQESERDALPNFEFLEINGMRLTEPRQAYVQIYNQLTGKTVSWQQAHSLLEKRFNTSAPRRITTVLLVDELDILCNRRQDVVYNLLDWPTKSTARLVVITIANTMDLPERLLRGKVTSRLGLTRLTFKPYTHKQLQEIVTARLISSNTFKGEAVQLVARKVAAVSGDARRALDICRRATEIAEEQNSSDALVNLSHVQQALSEMIASAKVNAIKNCSRLEQIFLQAIAAEVARTGVEETCFMNVYSQMESITAFLGIVIPNPGRVLKLSSKLGSQRLIICEHTRNDIFQKILLNISADDIHFALKISI